MKIAFVLDRPELCGGVKVVFQDATLLINQGFDVTVYAVGALPAWSFYSGAYVDLTTEYQKKTHDLVVATFWSTVNDAERMNMGPIVHYCQGYEASYPHLANQVPEIERVYAKPYPCFTVSQYLADRLKQRFNKAAFVIPPPLDEHFKPVQRPEPNSPYNILVSGIFECTWKGVLTALNTVKMLRTSGISLNLTRISLLPQSQEERAIVDADAFYCHIEPAKVAQLTAKADLVLFTSHNEEGFGLPLIEALASGVPCVTSDIASTREITRGKLPLIEPLDTHGFYQQAKNLLTNKLLWSERATLGLELAEPYRQSALSDTLTKAVKWALAHY